MDLSRQYCADFETTTDPERCHVWAWGLANIGSLEFEYGNTLDSFMKRVLRIYAPFRVWFHNLAFDGKFILDWLLKHKYEYVNERPKHAHEFSCVISNLGQFYSISVGKYLVFADSFKKISLSVKTIAKTYGLEMTKGDLDYNVYREEGHNLTDEELDYLRRDVLIVAQVMKQRLEMGDALTTSSDCLKIFKGIYKKSFRDVFPVIEGEIEHYLRGAYRGGWVYVNPAIQGKDITQDGIRLDVNSLYPFVMDTCFLPYGEPQSFNGEPNMDVLWVGTLSLKVKLKADKYPCIAEKACFLFGSSEYVTSTSEPITITICSVDWQLIQEVYDVEVYEWFGGYSFRGMYGLFSEYVNTYREEKETAPNPGIRYQAKLKLNSLYGKMAQKTEVTGKVPYLDEGVVHYRNGDEEIREGVYLPAGIFICAYARAKTIRAACSFGERFCYADTDSVHAIGTDIPAVIEIDDSKFGAWKCEATFTRARFVKQKVYVEVVGGVAEYKCAGMSPKLVQIMEFDDFKEGFTTKECSYYLPAGCGKDCETCYNNTRNWGLRPKNVAGGVILAPHPFSIM